MARTATPLIWQGTNNEKARTATPLIWQGTGQGLSPDQSLITVAEPQLSPACLF